jgi:hypothetical protein
MVEIIASATDDKGISSVSFYVDAVMIKTDAVVPYTALWDCSDEENESNHIIYAVAYDTDNNSSGSTTIQVTIDTSLSAPETPVLYIATDITDSSVTLTWSKNNNPDFLKYTIWYDTSSLENPTENHLTVYNREDTSTVISSLCDNITYYFRIQVDDLYSHSSMSNVIEAAIANKAPVKAQLLQALRTHTGVSVAWIEVQICDFAKYELIRSIDSVLDDTDIVVVTINDQSITFYEDTGVDSLEYFYGLRVTDKLDFTSMSDFTKVSAHAPNSSLYFDGNQYATIPFYPELNLGDQYTLEAWVNPSTIGGPYTRIIDKGAPNQNSPYLQYSLICGNSLGSDFCNGSSYNRVSSSFGVPTNEWKHIALTYDFGIMVFFLDGEPVDTITTSNANSCGFQTTLNIGRRKMFDEFYFNGFIDEVRVWNVIRSEAEILSWYNKHIHNIPAGLVGYWDFDDGSGDVIFSPVGANGYLGSSPGNDGFDPTWSDNTAPIIY